MRSHKKHRDKKYKYVVIVRWSEEDQGYGIEVPELPGCFSFGKTPQEAIKNATDAIQSWMESAEEAKIPIPEPMTTKKFSGTFNLRLSPELHRELAIKAKKKSRSLNSYITEILEQTGM